MTETPPGREPLSQDALRAAAVRPGGLWSCLTVLAGTGSTNADLAAAAATGAPEGTVLLAERQDAGRGRLGRTWTSPPGASLLLSVLLRPAEGPDPIDPIRYGWLPLLMGVALVDAVREVASVDAVLKWPNDLLVGPVGRAGAGQAHQAGGRAKCAGILAELVPVGDGAPGVVVGVGLNVTLRAGELPRADATSLLLAGAQGAGLDRGRLLVALLGRLADRYRRLRADKGDPAELRAAYLGRCDTVGRQVRVELPTGKALTGTASDVDGDGRLVVTPATGAAVAVAAGDVVHVRPGRT